MRRNLLESLVRESIKFNMLICFISFLLKQIPATNKMFNIFNSASLCSVAYLHKQVSIVLNYIFIGSLVAIFWLCVAGIILFIDFLVNQDDP